jgi:N12 class adenine-specific DNA methylase
MHVSNKNIKKNLIVQVQHSPKHDVVFSKYTAAENSFKKDNSEKQSEICTSENPQRHPYCSHLLSLCTNARALRKTD